MTIRREQLTKRILVLIFCTVLTIFAFIVSAVLYCTGTNIIDIIFKWIIGSSDTKPLPPPSDPESCSMLVTQDTPCASLGISPVSKYTQDTPTKLESKDSKTQLALVPFKATNISTLNNPTIESVPDNPIRLVFLKELIESNIVPKICKPTPYMLIFKEMKVDVNKSLMRDKMPYSGEYYNIPPLSIKFGYFFHKSSELNSSEQHNSNFEPVLLQIAGEEKELLLYFEQPPNRRIHSSCKVITSIT